MGYIQVGNKRVEVSYRGVDYKLPLVCLHCGGVGPMWKVGNGYLSVKEFKDGWYCDSCARKVGLFKLIVQAGLIW